LDDATVDLVDRRWREYGIGRGSGDRR
jgi:hypothetical protein